MKALRLVGIEVTNTVGHTGFQAWGDRFQQYESLNWKVASANQESHDLRRWQESWEFDTLLPEGRRFSLLRESLESTELNPDTFPDLKTAQRAFFGIAHSYLEVIRSQGFLKEGA